MDKLSRWNRGNRIYGVVLATILLNLTIWIDPALAISPLQQPNLSIIGPTAPIPEGQSGSTNVQFQVRLSAPSGQTVTVNFTTENINADSGSDYVAASGVA